MRVLVIWCEIPDEAKFFALENPSDDELAILQKTNGAYINTDSGAKCRAALTTVNAAVSESGEGYPKAYQKWVGRWLPGKIEQKDLPNAGAFDKVFVTGFYL